MAEYQTPVKRTQFRNNDQTNKIDTHNKKDHEIKRNHKQKVNNRPDSTTHILNYKE